MKTIVGTVILLGGIATILIGCLNKSTLGIIAGACLLYVGLLVAERLGKYLTETLRWIVQAFIQFWI